MRIEKAQMLDLDKILDMFLAEKNDKNNLAQWNEFYPNNEIIIEDIENGFGQVLKNENEIIAYVSASTKDEIIDTFPHSKSLTILSRLVVQSSWRQKGLAKDFIERVLIQIKTDAIGLLITPSNHISIKLATSLGFTHVGDYEYEWGIAMQFQRINNKHYQFISWNVNGLRAVMNKNFMEFLAAQAPDIMALQEIKMNQSQATFSFPGYYEYWHSADRPGYSGTLILTKKLPLNVTYDLSLDYHPREGRIITLEFEDFYFVNVYVPNSQRDLARLEYRMQFEDDFRNYLIDLSKKKGVVLCGDLNVAHQAIDLKNPNTNERSAGFTIEERNKFTKLLSSGFIDTYRYLYPNKIEYTWWSYMMKARERNIGWRIDYFLLSNNLINRLIDSKIYHETWGSDHCPVGLWFKNE